MNLEPRLRNALRHEASRAEPTVDPDDIVRKARRRHRGVVGASSAGTAVVLVLALVVSLPLLLWPQGRSDGVVPAAPGTTPTSPAGSQESRGKVALRFEVRVTSNPLTVRGTTQANATTFFAEVLPVAKHDGPPTAPVPVPRPGVGYISKKLSDKDGDGTYHARIMLEPGKYLAAIFSGTGIHETPDGAYPGEPTALISQDSDDFRDGVIKLSSDRTISVTYPAAPDTTTSGNETDKRSDGGPPGHELARLTAIDVRHGNTYSTVTLRFTPGRGTPTVSVEEVDDTTLSRPGSGKKVRLSGDQALRVEVANAIVGKVRPFTGSDPTITEVRVLGFFEGRTSIGIGVRGTGELAVEVSRPDQRTIRIAVPIPSSADPGRTRCGDVGFAPNSHMGAFGIVASGVGCDVARSVAAESEGEGGQPYTTPNGFRCTAVHDNSGPTPETVYTCVRGDATVTFNM